MASRWRVTSGADSDAPMWISIFFFFSLLLRGWRETIPDLVVHIVRVSLDRKLQLPQLCSIWCGPLPSTIRSLRAECITTSIYIFYWGRLWLPFACGCMQIARAWCLMSPQHTQCWVIEMDRNLSVALLYGNHNRWEMARVKWGGWRHGDNANESSSDAAIEPAWIWGLI